MAPRSVALHSERLTAPWWLWLPALGLAGLIAAELSTATLSSTTAQQLSWLPYALLPAAAIAGLWLLGRLPITVGAGELRVDDARLPVRHIAGVTVLGPEEKRLLLGPAAHRYAFVVQRPWIRGAVQVHLDDPADPTPYWVVSSRRPAALAEALLTARAPEQG